MIRRPPISTLFPYTTPFRSIVVESDSRLIVLVDDRVRGLPLVVRTAGGIQRVPDRQGAGDALTVGYTLYSSRSPYNEWQTTNPVVNKDDESGIAFYDDRSEGRRVGKECRYRWAPYHLKKKKKSSRVNRYSYTNKKSERNTFADR